MRGRLIELDFTDVRAAVSADLAAAPGLLDDPREGIVAIEPVAAIEVIHALRIVSAAKVLDHDRKAVSCEERPIERGRLAILVVWRADQNHRKGPGDVLGSVEVGREPDPIAHRIHRFFVTSTS